LTPVKSVKGEAVDHHNREPARGRPIVQTGIQETDMANITRYDPFEDIARLSPFRSFDDMFKGMRLRPWPGDVDVEPQIKIDVSEDEKSYTVKADIPGVKKDDIQVSVEGNQVSIEAESNKEREEKKGDTVLRSERYYGRVFRSFALAHEVDGGKAEAKYQDGVLELKLPKKSNGASKTVKVL
jgi:HSP20 family protein